MNSTVIHFANTFVGKPGNIGVRTARILKLLAAQNRGAVCACRGTVIDIPGTQFIDMGWLGHVPRAMNAARIYLWPRFNHRPLDIALFEHFSLRRMDKILGNDSRRIAHVWDNCPHLIRRLKSEGLRVLLDVPIAPLTYGKRMKASGRATFLLDDPKLIDIELAAFAEADRLIAPSAFVADELTRAGVPAERIFVIEFGADVSGATIPQTPRQGELRKSNVDFCFVGVINRRKGILELLQAWSHPAFAADRLHLCGRLFPEVRSALASAKGGRVMLPGFIHPPTYLPGCDVLVFPSWLEGSAKAVFEAMACGLPAIVTTSTGSVIRDGIDGFVIEPGDTNALRERMLWFKAHPEQIAAMGARARERACEFSWARYANRVVDLYSRGFL